jgi:two-component system, response regulator PdtaR
MKKGVKHSKKKRKGRILVKKSTHKKSVKQPKKKSSFKRTEPHQFLIAIVDDHIDTAISISHMLEYYGFRTIQAYHGEQGIDMCKSGQPDILLLDIKMEGMSGFEVAEALPNQKIFFFTANGVNRKNLVKFKKQTVGILHKPLDIQELIEKVAKVLGVKKEKVTR